MDKLNPAKRRRSGSQEESLYVELVRTTDVLSRGLADILKSESLSLTQYNVLRILRGARKGLSCGEIASRMITRDPDVTRLVDRLVKRGLVSRTRTSRDRRTMVVRIKPEGLQILSRLDEPILQAHRRQLGHLGVDRLHALAELLQISRERVV